MKMAEEELLKRGVVQKPEGVETPSVDWDAFRREVAKDLSCSLLNAGMRDTWAELARYAIKGADELIKQLRGE